MTIGKGKDKEKELYHLSDLKDRVKVCCALTLALGLYWAYRFMFLWEAPSSLLEQEHQHARVKRRLY